MGDLDAFLAAHAAPFAREVAETVRSLAAVGVALAATIAEGPHGDAPRGLDLLADDQFLGAMSASPVGIYASEALSRPVLIDGSRPLALAIDPLDGAGDSDVNVPVGTIFSIRRRAGDPEQDALTSFLARGRDQLAAGFLIYGAQLALVLTLGDGTHLFVHSRGDGRFRRVGERRAIPPKAAEFAINAADYRHWDEVVRLYFDDCIKGGHGPRETEFNMRWIASTVAEAYRILLLGGVFLAPGDKRRGRAHGRLRLVYEAHPIALLVEQAGGRATDTVDPILDLAARELHQCTPFIFGSSAEVTRIGRYHTMPSQIAERAPLFGKRGLFRA